MMTPKDCFEKNNYVVLTGALPLDECKNLTDYMFKLYDEDKLIKDPQCPLSDSIYGAPVFDELLQKYAEPLGQHIGKKLLPTYTYARIYRPGEVLEKHKDRPACEISATITLGFDSKPVWPIFMGNGAGSRIDMEIGDLVLYKGTDIDHWRDEFKGKWQVQVFFHYVDENGPYKNEYMDGRVKFGVDKDDPRNLREFHKSNDITLGERPADAQDLTNQKPQVKLPIYNAILLPNNDEYIPGYICHTKERNPELVYTEEECDKILELTKTSYCTPASVGGSTHNSAINKKIRSANIYDVLLNEENKWIYDKLMMNVAFANKYHFDYEIAGVLHSLQLIEYDTSDEDNVGHYDWHTDFGMGDPATRKISVVVQLSDPNDYEECELMVNDHGNVLTATKERGSVHLFPSYQSHTVTNIKSGKRYSLVIWIHGSRRFR